MQEHCQNDFSLKLMLNQTDRKMKKVLMMAVVAAMATTAFAQDDLVKEAKKLCSKGELEQAVTTITPALTSNQTEDKAEAWNVMSEIQYQIFMKGQEAEKANKENNTTTPYDTAAMHKAMVAALEAAIKCDEYDRQPNEKGKVKIRFREANGRKFYMSRPFVISAGLYEYNNKNLEEAVKDWKLYIDSAEDPLFTGIDMTKDQYRSEVCYYIGLSAYNLKDYATATKYAEMAAQDSAKAKEAGEILLFAKRDGAKTKEDSLEYLAVVKDLHSKFPSETRYFNMLMDYYSKPGRQAEMKQWTEEEIAKDPNNKMTWALKGEVEMNTGKWDEAVASYKKAAEIDPTFVQVIFNAGICLNQKAIELKDKLADKKTGGLTTENANKVKAILADAKVYLEKSREIDPNREKVDWAYPLYQIYYNLGDNAKADEMEKLVNNK